MLRDLISWLKLHWPAENAGVGEFLKNEAVRSRLYRHGDNCRAARPIRHYTYFPDTESVGSFREFIVSRGYKIESEHGEAAPPNMWALIFSKTQPPIAIDEETALLAARAKSLEGEYDGWETELLRPS